MTFALQSKPAQDSLNARATLALRLVLAVSLAAACVMALAESPTEVEDSVAASARDVGEPDLEQLEQLEQVFWFCDHAASTDGVDGPTGIACGIATEELKQRRFGGNFAAMLRWWQANKGAMHQALNESRQQAEALAAEATAEAEDYPMP